MLYGRRVDDDVAEYCRLVGEEKLAAAALGDGRNLDRCLVTSTGFDLRSTDIEIIG